MNSKENTNDSVVSLGWGERIGFGAGGMGYYAIFSMTGTYLTMYLTNVALLDIAVVSTIIAVSKVFDGISDVIIGNTVDHTSSRFGKARVWLLRMCIPFAVSTVLLFLVPPVLPKMAQYIYVFLLYNLTNTVFLTFMQISHMALLSLMTGDRDEQGLGSVFLGYAMAAAGFDGALKVQPAAVNTVIAIAFAWAPGIVFGVLFFVFWRFFDLEKKLDELETTE